MKTIASTHVTIYPGSNIYLVAAEMIVLARKVEGIVVTDFSDGEKAMSITVHPSADVISVVQLYKSIFEGKETT